MNSCRFQTFLILISFLLLGDPRAVFANDIPQVRGEAKRIVAQLASAYFWGRGYTKHGMSKAAHFLEHEIQSYGLAPLDGHSFRQAFRFPVNTFPGKMEVRLNDRRLVPGEDFILAPASKGVKQSGELAPTAESDFSDPTGKILVSFKDKLTWSVAMKTAAVTQVFVDKKKFTETPTRFSFDIDQRFIPSFVADNLAAVVRGTVHPDHYIILTAHYDHLGGMGAKTYFPGANDNASGVSLLLSLAKYYVAHPQPYSIAFVFFAGEEAGLIGSKYFVEHPLVDLNRIRFVMNFDLVGTGEEGATVVNATEFPNEFTALLQINSEGRFLTQIHPRGKAPNSDHYWFSESGVPAFFLYTMGGIRAYHDVYDRSATLPLNKIDDVFALILKFTQKLTEE